MNAKAAGADKPRMVPFPGGEVAPASGELRIAIEKKPYAEIIGHAVLEPEVEVCGVLVGYLHHDAHGPFIHVTHTIRGEAAKQQGAQVTFTHDTWNHIHQEMDRDHADREILGWYHTHGGFGVFLSDMDTFIHKNFFSGAHHVAYVFDPLAGSEGFFHLSGSDLKPARRYWIAGRERRIAVHAPSGEAQAAPGGDMAVAAAALQQAAAAFQAANYSRPAEGNFTWWILGIAAVAMLALTLFGGGLFGREAQQDRSTRAMLVVQRDPSGAAVGVPLEVVQHQEGPVYRDASGRLYLGVENPAVVGSLLKGAPLAGPGAAPPAPAPAPVRRGLPWWGTVLVGLGAMGAGAALPAAWSRLRRRRA